MALKMGAFFTRTNLSFEDFGEGSFDKGIYFEIPLIISFQYILIILQEFNGNHYLEMVVLC